MKINFFDKGCDFSLDDARFGICDNQNQSPAFCTVDNEVRWGAEVLNQTKKNVRFVAIDNCIDIRRPNGDMERRCDAMLTYEDGIDFVELKDVARGSIADGAEQIFITLRVFTRFHDLKQFRRRRAFICNIQHPNFRRINLETKQRFESEFGMRLFVQHDIVI